MKIQELLNEEQVTGDSSLYKVKNITTTYDGKRMQFDAYKKRKGRFVKVGVFTAKKGTPEDKLWKEIDAHFQKHDDGAED